MLIDVGSSEAILLNLVNGNADVVGGPTRKAIRDGEYGCIPSHELDQLIDRKYVFSDPGAAASYVQSVEKSLIAQMEELPPSFVYIPSYSCNLNCYYCFEKAYDHDMSLPDQRSRSSAKAFLMVLETIVRSFEEAHRTKLDSKDILVTITGGEPFIPENYSTILTLLKGCRNLGITPSFVTNGYFLEPFLPVLKEFGVSDIQITLDGSKPIHDSIRITKAGDGTFDQIVRSIEALNEFAEHLSVRVNAMKRNLPSIDDPSFSKLINKYPNVFFYLYFMQQEGCADRKNVLNELEGLKTALRIQECCPDLKNLDISYHGENIVRPIFGHGTFRPKIAMCAAMSNQYIFDYTGRIYKCWWGMGNPNYQVGDFSVSGHSINRKLESPYRSRYVTSIPKCSRCRFRLICGGGCTGRLSRQDFSLGRAICPDFESILPFMVRHLYQSGESHARA